MRAYIMYAHVCEKKVGCISAYFAYLHRGRRPLRGMTRHSQTAIF